MMAPDLRGLTCNVCYLLLGHTPCWASGALCQAALPESMLRQSLPPLPPLIAGLGILLASPDIY